MSKPRMAHTLETLTARTVEEGDCLIWQGYISNKTPQVVSYPGGKKTMVSARKLMRELQIGKPQPKGSYGNTCDNHNCVNPDHTIWKSELVHMRYMAKKRVVSNVTASKLRQYRVDTGQVKLCESKAQEIRLSDESGPVLAERFGVSKSWINKIKRGEVWRVLSSPWQGLFK